MATPSPICAITLARRAANSSGGKMLVKTGWANGLAPNATSNASKSCECLCITPIENQKIPGNRSAIWTAKVSTQVMFTKIPPAAAGGSFNPGLQGARNALESHRRQPVDRSIPARASNNGKQSLGLNDPPAAAGGIAENLSCPR